MTINWVKIESARQDNALKMNHFNLNIETLKQFSDLAPTLK